MADRLEYLVIRGRLDRAGQFTPRRCTSTSFVHRWPRGTSAAELVQIGAGGGGRDGAEVVVETLSDDGTVLARELAQVRLDEVCAPGEVRSFRVLAYIGLHPKAVSVRLRQDERVLWEMRVPEAPRLEVRLERAPRRGGRSSRPGVLALDVSAPADEELAFVSVVFRWAERGYRTVYVGPPESRIEVPVDGLGGGRECRLFVTYSNGLRGTAAATEPFELAELGPSVTLLRPGDGDKTVAGTPVALEGFAEDPEHPGAAARADDRLVWLVDGDEVATGPSTSVDGLSPGRHEVTLVYRRPEDSPGAAERGTAAQHGDKAAREDTVGRAVRDRERADAEARATVRVSAAEASEPPADQWPDWDPVELT